MEKSQALEVGLRFLKFQVSIQYKIGKCLPRLIEKCLRLFTKKNSVNYNFINITKLPFGFPVVPLDKNITADCERRSTLFFTYSRTLKSF